MADINLFLRTYGDQTPVTLEAHANHLSNDNFALAIRAVRGYTKEDEITIFTNLENLEALVTEITMAIAEVKVKAKEKQNA